MTVEEWFTLNQLLTSDSDLIPQDPRFEPDITVLINHSFRDINFTSNTSQWEGQSATTCAYLQQWCFQSIGSWWCGSSWVKLYLPWSRPAHYHLSPNKCFKLNQVSSDPSPISLVIWINRYAKHQGPSESWVVSSALLWIQESVIVAPQSLRGNTPSDDRTWRSTESKKCDQHLGSIHE